MITLHNETLTAIISPLGAELQSLLHANGLQYMWGGNPAFWGKHSPVLFPIVGTLAGDSYEYGGKMYSLPRHGFARNMVFTVEQAGPSEAVFILASNEETLQAYPFEFTLQLSYQLQDNQLQCSYTVSNPGHKTLLFSVGGHPAFAVPLLPGAAYTDYYLQFNADEPLQRHHLQNGLLSGATEMLSAPNGRLALEPGLFYNDAIVLKHLQSDSITLASSKHTHGLHFHYKNFPYLGIWGAKDAPFVCVEPWCGVADSTNHNQKLEDKEGIMQLEAGQSWQRTWMVECF